MKNTNGKADKTDTKRNGAEAPKATISGTLAPNLGTPAKIVELCARVKGEVLIRLKVFDSGYSAQKIARLLNSGNVSWDVGTGARYHRVEKNGKLIAEIELADEDTYWERYEANC
jgi:hypothetical protein